MKLQYWMMLSILMIGGLGQYSINAMANVPAFSSDFAQLALQETSTAPLNINKASAEELATLPGIGTKKAIAIIQYRDLNGKFMSIEELVNVKGIGPKMLIKLTGSISI